MQKKCQKEVAKESQKMADSVKKGQMKKCWSEVKRIRGCKTTVTASLDGETDDERIAIVFACKYNALYNCVSYDSNDLNGIKREIDTAILESTDITCVTTYEIRVAITSLKSDKSDGNYGLWWNHLIHGGHRLNEYLCILFNIMLTHGVSADMLKGLTLVSIPKDNRKSINSSDNYRAIALTSSIGKLLDLIIIRKYGDLLNTCDLQCGFKVKRKGTPLWVHTA